MDNAKRTIYNVWVEVHIEEMDEETGNSRDICIDVNSRLIQDADEVDDLLKIQEFRNVYDAHDLKNKIWEVLHEFGK